MNNNNSKALNIVKQGSILAIAGILARFLGFLYRIPLTNMLGDRGNAIYASGYYIYTLFLVISSAGLPAAISKMVSERLAKNKPREAHSIFRVSILFACVSGFIGMAILLIFPIQLENFGDVEGSRYAIMSLAPTIFIVSIMSVFRGYFQGMKSTMPTATSQIIEQIMNAIFSIIMCYAIMNATFSATLVGGSLAGGAAGGTIGTGIGALFGLITLIYIYNKHKKNIFKNVKADKTRVSPASSILKELVFTSVPIILGAAVFSFTNFIDMGMIQDRLMDSGAFTKAEAEILYGQLTGKFLVLTSLPISISTSLATASIPEIAEEIAVKNTRAANDKINFTVKLTMLVSIPAGIGLSVLADQILWCFFWGAKDGGILLKIGGISVIFLALTQILGGMLQGISKYYIPVIAAICGGIIKIIINYNLVVIPEINVIGAIIGTIVCYAVASIIDLYFVQKYTRVRFDIFSIFLKPFFSSLLMGLFVFFSYKLFFTIIGFILSPYLSNAIAMVLSILVGVVIYFVSLYKIKGLTVLEIENMPYGRKIINKLNLQ